MTNDELEDELTGNEGRKAWNARPQSAEDAQSMLAGAIRTIDTIAWALLNAQGRFLIKADPSLQTSKE